MSDKHPVLDGRFLGLINAYLDQNLDPETRVTEFCSPEEMRSCLDLNFPAEGCTLDELYKTIDEYLRHSVRTGHPQFTNQLWSGFTLPGFLGDVFTSLTNTSMYTFEVAPVATLMEKELITKMGRLAGFKDPEGLLLTGGSNGNLQAMMIARNRAVPDLKRRGCVGNKILTAFVSEEAHYSFEKAANILGLGEDNVIKVRTDKSGCMLPEDLEQKIEASRSKGQQPFFLAATAGTTVKGAFDPCEPLAALAQQYGLWFHVDGSLGGTALLSPSHRYLLKGLEQADSFIWNAHKLMGLPLICSIFLVRKAGRLYKTNSVSGADYIFHDEAYGETDLGPISLQCGRRVDALKLWLSWKFYGEKGYAARVDRFFELAKYAEQIVQREPSLELMAPRSSVTVCFRFACRQAQDPNTFNLKVREKLARDGKCLVNYARLGEDVVIRLVIANHDLTEADIDRFFRNFLEAAASLDYRSV